MKPDGATRLHIVPVTFQAACGFVELWHRHHPPALVLPQRGRRAPADALGHLPIGGAL